MCNEASVYVVMLMNDGQQMHILLHTLHYVICLPIFHIFQSLMSQKLVNCEYQTYKVLNLYCVCMCVWVDCFAFAHVC